MLSAAEAKKILQEAEQVCSEQEVAEAVRRIAREVTQALAEAHPLVLSVMGGAVIFTGQLLPLLRFPLHFDYLHVTRYGNTTQGGELSWIVSPRLSVKGRTVLILDDVLDAGITLAAIKKRILEDGAAACYTAVFAEKDLGQEKPITADFTGVHLPNRYVFGFGMDVQGAWRNLPAVYAVKEGGE